jgi:hypothetical protein
MLKKLSNGQLSFLIILLVALLMVVSVMDVITSILTIVLVVGITPAVLSYSAAKFIDYMDDSIEYAVEMSGLYHLVYAFGISFALAIILGGVVTSSVIVPIWLIQMIAPKVVFTVLCFIFAAIGYWVAWRTIPNKAGK